MDQSPSSSHAQVSVGADKSLKLEGRLDAEGVSKIWNEANRLVQTSGISSLDVQNINYCDSAGMALLLHLQNPKGTKDQQSKLALHGVPSQFKTLFESLPSTQGEERPSPPSSPPFLEVTGRKVIGFFQDLYAQLAFVGELVLILLSTFSHLKRVRWKTFWEVFESAGVNALPIITLIGFLTGCILAFQSLVPLRKFGIDIFAVNLTALSLLRELGPIMTAIILAGRSGSAFAAELGTMKVNQELDALTTMGINSLRFLVLPRLLAAFFITPLLSIYMNGIGIFGGLVVMMGMGYPLAALFTQLTGAVEIKDVVGGLIKSFFFGILVSSIGCLRGLQTGKGATAVGEATTRSVVSGIILVIAADAIFSAVFYVLNF